MTKKSYNFLYILLPSLLLAVLCLNGLIRYPEVFENAKKEVLTVFTCIIIYLIIWSIVRPDRFSSNAGLWIGALLMLNLWAEDFIDWKTNRTALIFTLVMMVLIFFSFCMISAIGVIKSGKFLVGLKSSLASALCGTLVGLCFGFLINYLAPGRMSFILRHDSGYDNFKKQGAYAFYNAFVNASNHIMMVPVVALVMGLIGGGMSLWFRRPSTGIKGY